jgi:hypothetical protein
LIHIFFGVSSIPTLSRTALETGPFDGLSLELGFAAQAKEMQRFFSKAWTAGSLAPPTVAASRGMNPVLHSRGLGELVRAGVVMPVPQVSSTVEARLVVLVIERRRVGRRTDPESLASSSD